MSLSRIRRVSTVVVVAAGAVVGGATAASAAPQVPHPVQTYTDVIPAEYCGVPITVTARDAQQPRGPESRGILTGPSRVDLVAADGRTATLNVSGPGFFGQAANGNDVVTGAAFIGSVDAAGDPVLLLTHGRGVVAPTTNELVSLNGRVTDVCTLLR